MGNRLFSKVANLTQKGARSVGKVAKKFGKLFSKRKK